MSRAERGESNLLADKGIAFPLGTLRGRRRSLPRAQRGGRLAM